MTLRCKLFGHKFTGPTYHIEYTNLTKKRFTSDKCMRCGVANPSFKQDITITKTETLDIPIEKKYTFKEVKMRSKSDVMKELNRGVLGVDPDLLIVELLLDIRDQLVELNKERI